MRRLLRSVYGAPFLLCLVIAAAAQSNPSPRGITAEDYFAFEFATDPRVSPDGKLAAYVVTRIDRAQNRRSSSIWMVALDGSRPPWQFTTSPGEFLCAPLRLFAYFAVEKFYKTNNRKERQERKDHSKTEGIPLC